MAPINPARIRERSFPLLAILQPCAETLRDTTRETIHATVLSPGHLLTVLVNEPDRATRVFMDASTDLSLHARTSGIVIAANMPAPRRAAMITVSGFERFTLNTPATSAALERCLQKPAPEGSPKSEQFCEKNTTGTAVALFGPNGQPAGTIAIAAVASRFDADLAHRTEHELMTAGHTLTCELGGITPAAPSSMPTKSNMKTSSQPIMTTTCGTRSRTLPTCSKKPPRIFTTASGLRIKDIDSHETD